MEQRVHCLSPASPSPSPPPPLSEPLLQLSIIAPAHRRRRHRRGTHLTGMSIEDSFEMQGVLCLPSGQLDRTVPHKIVDMEVTGEPPHHVTTTKEINQSDSGIFSATGNSTFPSSVADEARSENETDNRSDCSTPDDRKYVCPICNRMLSSQHEFTLHIRSHNNEAEAPQDPEKGYTCRICAKVLSSSSSLDRHVLVHSGERPFTCKYCGDTFTTNGNMHRHMRTHKATDNYESDGSVDSSASSGSKSIEYNNNKVDKIDSKRKLESDDGGGGYQLRKKAHLEIEDEQFKCPVCCRDDFLSKKSLEVHLEDNHPDYPAKCHQCNQIFNNQKRLNYHKSTVHADDSNGKTKNVVVGFKHIDYVDFTSEKFPHIARHVCEQVFHKPTDGPKYVCGKCSRAFPCDKSLEFHMRECGTSSERTAADIQRGADSIKREEFFHRLDLEDTHPVLRSLPALMLPAANARLEEAMKAMDHSKDLADIQSIISLTNGSFLQQLQGKSGGGGSVGAEQLDSERTEEEESQDVFAQEFRKMKLRGEFPCRLCTAVFPNLRALKGHNRTHLNAAHNGTYRCNMCPHSSLDKAALIRHMRTHNGDRPYECSLCNYAFTTKANCERHLRNRHAKNTREEVKKAIIYHPSEDPTNDEANKQLDTSKKLNTSSNSIDSTDLMMPARSSTPKATVPPAFPDVQLNKDYPIPFSLAPKIPSVGELITENLKALGEQQRKEAAAAAAAVATSNWASQFATSTPNKPAIPTIRVKNVNVLKEIPEQEAFSDGEDNEPMALDLSKKKSDKEPAEETFDDRYASKDPAPAGNPMTDFLTQQFLQSTGLPAADPTTALLVAQMAWYKQNLQNCMPAFPAMHFLRAPMLPEAPTLTAEMKERLQRQLSGGGIKNVVYPPTNYPLFSEMKIEAPLPQPEAVKPLSLNVDTFNENIQMKASPVLQAKAELLQSPNSVKMVIKNGVLMPKQKQRRYRTERPFSCEHCAARFTLRSNMERHIKQQHPQYWSQRQRTGGAGTPGRKPHLASTASALRSPGCELSIPSYEASTKPSPQPDSGTDDKTSITEKLRYAILSQHLRAAHESHVDRSEEAAEEEDALVIDEPDEMPKPEPVRQEMPKSRILEEKLRELRDRQIAKEHEIENQKKAEDASDLVPIARLLVNASQQQHELKEYFHPDHEDNEIISEEDEEGLVASGSTSDGNSGTDENRSESDNVDKPPEKKKSAYSLAPNRVSCPYCSRKFPWTSSLRRHILTHTGQKPFKCSHCPLLFTTKSNCDRHLLRKHGNSATTITNETSPASAASSNSFMMRNVPERPFKCSNCPSSTFSTYSNLKKHMSSKHGSHDDRQGYEAGSSEDEKNNSDHCKSDWEAPIAPTPKLSLIGENAAAAAAAAASGASVNSDLPFKCHLCDHSFGERQECLDHIRDLHASEYDLLMSKNALDPNATTPEEGNNHDDDDDGARGKFPDYSNRKVICAFCMRRFWSAEDLRRHMRTHTGERPFSCDICRRRFTLKHSMLRHRKKHSNLASFEADNNQSDDECFEKKLPPLPSKSAMKRETTCSTSSDREKEDSDVNESGSDLISNLLGIRDRSLIEQVLTGSADNAAKLLGVGKE